MVVVIWLNYILNVGVLYSTLSVKHHSETHTIKSAVMKQHKGLNGDLKPEQKI